MCDRQTDTYSTNNQEITKIQETGLQPRQDVDIFNVKLDGQELMELGTWVSINGIRYMGKH